MPSVFLLCYCLLWSVFGCLGFFVVVFIVLYKWCLFFKYSYIIVFVLPSRHYNYSIVFMLISWWPWKVACKHTWGQQVDKMDVTIWWLRQLWISVNTCEPSFQLPLLVTQLWMWGRGASGWDQSQALGEKWTVKILLCLGRSFYLLLFSN